MLGERERGGRETKWETDRQYDLAAKRGLLVFVLNSGRGRERDRVEERQAHRQRQRHRERGERQKKVRGTERRDRETH